MYDDQVVEPENSRLFFSLLVSTVIPVSQLPWQNDYVCNVLLIICQNFADQMSCLR